MSATLPQRLSDLRRRIRQALWACGLSRVASIAITAVLAACLADRVVHFDGGVRFIFALSVLAASAWGAWRFLVVPLSVPLGNVDVALRIEDRYPDFHDSLASSVQFLEARGDPRLGSPELQRAVVRDTLTRLRNFDTGDVLELREVRRSMAIAMGLCLTAAVFAGLDHHQTAVALERLFLPFSSRLWPRQTNLRLLDADLRPLPEGGEPIQVARGEGYKLHAENQSGRLPSHVVLEYRHDDGRVSSEVMRPVAVNVPEGGTRELAVAQLPLVKGEIEFRATGGDDESMEWHRLEIIPPPVIEELQVVLTPPPYSRRPVETLPAGTGHVHGLVGTRVDVVAKSSKDLQSAYVRLRNHNRHSIKIGDDGRHLEFSFLISESGIYSWWLELIDVNRFENSDPPRYEIHGVLDAEPQVRIDLPTSDLQITADAEVFLRTTAKDDLGLKEMRLVFHQDGDERGKDVMIPLFSSGTGEASERPLEQAVDFPWKLEELALQEGQRLVLHTEATDDFDLSKVLPRGSAPPPHVGRSVSRTLTVVSRERKTQELAQRQAGLLDDLDRAFRLQKQARAQVRDLQTQIETTGQLRNEDLDTLQRTEIGQREVSGQLTNPVQGLERRARNLLDELRGNHLEDAPSERRLEEIAGELERLAEDRFPAIEQGLTQTRKLLQSKSGRTAPSTEKERERSPGTVPRKSGAADQQRSGPGGDRSSDASSNPPPSSENTARPQKPAQKNGDPQPAPGGNQASDSGNPSEDGKSPEEPGEPSEDREDSQAQTASERRDDVKPADRAGRRPSKPEKTLSTKSTDTPEAALQQVAENQEEVLGALEDLLQDLSQWRNEYDAAREVSDLISQQQALNEKARELGRQTLTRSRERLSPQEQADLARLADRQKKQADQFDQLQARLKEKVDSSSETDSGAAAALSDALDQARDQAVSEQMREAAGQIGENRMGEAARSQEEVLEKLKELEKTLGDHHESDTETLVKKLKQAASDLERLRSREQGLLEKLEAAGSQGNSEPHQEELKRLEKQQKQLREETAKLARKLQRLKANRASAAAQRAASGMQQAQESVAQGEEEDALREQQESLDDLQQAEREVARDLKRAEEQLAFEQLETIAGELKSMIDLQEAAIAETRRLDDLRKASGRLSRAQLQALNDLAATQLSLREDTERLTEKLTAAKVFAQALRGAARSMQRAVDLLRNRETGADTQQNQESAKRRFVDLVDAWKNSPDKSTSSDPVPPLEQKGNSGQNQTGSPGELVSRMAELKMLLSLQRELLERTTQLNRLRESDTPLSPAQEAEFESLTLEQSELADLTRNLMRTTPQEAPTTGKSGSRPDLQKDEK